MRPAVHQKRFIPLYLESLSNFRPGLGLPLPDQCFSTGAKFAPRGTSGNVWRYFWFSLQLGAKGLLASSGQRPESLLNILQCPGQPPTTKNYPAPNASSVEAEKSHSIPQLWDDFSRWTMNKLVKKKRNKVNQILIVWLWDTCCLLQGAFSNLIFGSPSLDTMGLCTSPIIALSAMLADGGHVIKDGCINAQLWDPTMGPWVLGVLRVHLTSPLDTSNVSSESLWGAALGNMKGQRLWRSWVCLCHSSLVYTRSWNLFSFSASHWQEYRFGFI